MADVSITINTAEVERRLNATPAQIRIANRQAMEDTMTLLLRDQRTYPVKPPPIQGPQLRPVRFTTREGVSVSFIARAPKQYRRTNTLQKSWSRKIVESGDSIRGRVGSNPNVAPYNRYVQDEAMQARIHAGRWTNTVQGTVRTRQATIQGFFEERLRRAVEGR